MLIDGVRSDVALMTTTENYDMPVRESNLCAGQLGLSYLELKDVCRDIAN